MSWADIVEENDHKQGTAGLYSLIGRVWTDWRHVKGLNGIEREGAVDRCGRTARRKLESPTGGDVRCRVGRLVQHLNEVRDGEGKQREGVTRVDGSRAVSGVVEDGFIKRTLVLRLCECLRVRTRIVQKKGVLG